MEWDRVRDAPSPSHDGVIRREAVLTSTTTSSFSVSGFTAPNRRVARSPNPRHPATEDGTLSLLLLSPDYEKLGSSRAALRSNPTLSIHGRSSTSLRRKREVREASTSAAWTPRQPPPSLLRPLRRAAAGRSSRGAPGAGPSTLHAGLSTRPGSRRSCDPPSPCCALPSRCRDPPSRLGRSALS